MKELCENLAAIGLNVIVFDDDGPEFVECPRCGAEMEAFMAEDGHNCEDCEYDDYMEQMGNEDEED